jgi:hypothetical protein
MVAITGKKRSPPRMKIMGEVPVRLTAGGAGRARIAAPLGRRVNQVKLALNEPPEGIAIQKVVPDSKGVTIVLRVDAQKAKPGLKGNLIVDAFIERVIPAKGGRKGGKRRYPMGTLPAIPFEIAQP